MAGEVNLSVHYLFPPDAEYLDYLCGQLDPGISLSTSDGESLPAETRILIAGRPKIEHLEACPDLNALIIPWAGLPDITRDLMLGYPDLSVYNLHHNAAPVAELAFTLLLTATKFIVPLDRALRANDWRPRYKPNPSMLLKEKTALILGYGAIGRRLARLCQAMDMQVLAVKRNPDSQADELVDEMYSLDALPDLLPRSHVLLICLPLTPETDGVIGAQELDALPAGAVLVNVGRGPVVDEKALYHALRDGRLAAAGLDVWYNYPDDKEERADTPPSAYPFHELDNVVLSPHRGGATMETNWLRMDGLASLLNAAAEGKIIPNKVDVAAGY
ncbi:MAG TPA: 2-hydroxyacid dehydrogenase [candidate division Zixibacteria bacterium]|nr:2-hydroxyacid dehydrogenase [candidate division Zixibacteria bacterium]